MSGRYDNVLGRVLDVAELFLSEFQDRSLKMVSLSVIISPAQSVVMLLWYK